MLFLLLTFMFFFPSLSQASKVGINLIVLDDGWFGTRADDASSLGDWVANLAKFPQGIKGTIFDPRDSFIVFFNMLFIFHFVRSGG